MAADQSLVNVPAIAIVSLTLLLLYKFLVYPISISPLAKIPNAHPLSSITSLWILSVRYRQRENRALQAAHAKYGPIVRLAPNELSVNCVEDGIRTIYAGGFEKSDWYTFFENFDGVPNMFSTLHSKPHSLRKRMLSNVFSKSYLQNSPAMSAIFVEVLDNRLLPILDKAANASDPVEVHRVWESLAMDMITAYTFGLTNFTNFLCEERKRTEFFSLYYSRHPYTFYAQEIPSFTAFLARFGIRLVPDEMISANKILHGLCLEWCDAAEETIRRHRQTDSQYANPAEEPVVFSQLYNAASAKSERRLDEQVPSVSKPPHSTPRLEIASEIFDQLGAGFETTSIALTYITYYLSLQPHFQRMLRRELLSLPSSSKVSAKDVDALPLLHALILETLRVQPSIPGAQPRVTPASGTTLAGHANIPPGVRVNAQAYSLHRNADVFPDPLEWHPERWLSSPNDSKEENEAMTARHRWFWAFGSGGQMKYTLASVYTHYRTSVVDDAGIEQEDGYTAHPVGKRLMLRFEKVENGDGE
ncbi:MAG: hypothetical protein M1837_004219 [Sclerophora amabilis]|nr:MAG: hypothetical protein M1837_004219 [Sclerophora amabilis]